MNGLRKAAIVDLLLDQMLPGMADQDWLLHQRETLFKLRDEMLLGVYFGRSGFAEIVYPVVFICPLYWPPAEYHALGLSSRFDVWPGGFQGWELDTPARLERSARELTQVMNRCVIPLFDRLPDGESVLRYWRTQTWDPFLSWRRIPAGGLYGWEEVLGYIAAWSGHPWLARTLLSIHLCSIGRGESDGYIAHAKRTLSLLNRPTVLREMLQETALQTRTAVRLDRARPVQDLLEQRSRQGAPRRHRAEDRASTGAHNASADDHEAPGS
jgi:hypothetical protein